jgi:hypothetical protein
MSIAASSPALAGERPEARQGRFQSLVREAVKEDRPRRRASGRRPAMSIAASSPALAGERSEARQGRLQSLVRAAVKEDRPRRRARGRRPFRGDVQSLLRRARAGRRVARKARQGRLQSLVRAAVKEDRPRRRARGRRPFRGDCNRCCAAPAQAGAWSSACVPSPVSGIRTSTLPLLPVWEKGVGGMRGHRHLPPSIEHSASIMVS